MSITLAILAAAAPFSHSPLPTGELADMRGGFALPGGLDVAIAIQTDTKVDGSLLLRTVYRVDQTTPKLLVYAPDRMPTEQSRSGAAAVPTAAGVTISVDRPRQGDFGAAPQGSAPVDFSKNGGTVAVPTGHLALTSGPAGQSVQLLSDQLQVNHLFQNAVGSVIANSANDRVIDTATTVVLDISGATPFNLGSSMLRVETLVTDSTALLLPR